MGAQSVRAQSRKYFAALGAYVAQRRKSMGYTQAELARALGVSQQAVFAYELGDRRISILVLEKMAKVLGVGVEEMIGFHHPRARKQRLSPRAIRHAERLQALPKTAQRFVIKIIDTLTHHRDADGIH
jgi:transcriptional regulator with XRE-family HTH domain